MGEIETQRGYSVSKYNSEQVWLWDLNLQSVMPETVLFTSMISLLPNTSYEQCLKETELLCLERKNHMFAILIALKGYHMEEGDKIRFMCCQSVVPLVGVMDREIKGIYILAQLKKILSQSKVLKDGIYPNRYPSDQEVWL